MKIGFMKIWKLTIKEINNWGISTLRKGGIGNLDTAFMQ